MRIPMPCRLGGVADCKGEAQRGVMVQVVMGAGIYVLLFDRREMGWGKVLFYM